MTPMITMFPRTKPTSPLMRSKTLRTRLVNTARTESRAEMMVAKIERKTSKMEEMRSETEETMDDMTVGMGMSGFGWSFE